MSDNQKKWLLTAIVLFVVAIGTVYGVVDSNKRAKEKAIKSAITDYSYYLHDNKIHRWGDKVYASYDYYNDLSYEGEVLMRTKAYIEDEINSNLDSFLDSVFYTSEDVPKLEKLMSESFVTRSNKKKYEESIDIFNRYYEVTASQTDEEIQAVYDVLNKQISVGMSRGMVNRKLGKPEDKTTSESEYGASEIWYYDDVTLYFSDGKVERIVR